MAKEMQEGKLNPNEGKLKALQAAMAKIEKDFGKGSIMKLGDEHVENIEVIPTGSIALDNALGVGGYPKGRIIEIYGPESSGKTTLAIHAIAEAQKAGGIAAFNKDLRKKYSEKDLKEIVSQKLELVGLQGIENKFPSELSGGMQKRVSFARAIVTKPNTILYDEPTAGLDPMSSTLIEDYIVRLKHEINAASIVVTHQMSTITRTADRVIMLYDGKIVFEGTPTQLLQQDNPYTKQFVTASLDGPMKMKA